MLSVYREMLLCFYHLEVSLLAGDSETVRRLFSTPSIGMAKKEENGKASCRLCIDLPRCDVYRDMVCDSSNGGMVGSCFVKRDYCSVGGLHSFDSLLSRMSGDK